MRTQRRRRPTLEPLESKALLSASGSATADVGSAVSGPSPDVGSAVSGPSPDGSDSLRDWGRGCGVRCGGGGSLMDCIWRWGDGRMTAGLQGGGFLKLFAAGLGAAGFLWLAGSLLREELEDQG